MTTKIVRIETLKTRRRGWPSWVVRCVTERGGYVSRLSFDRSYEAYRYARSLQVQHKAPVVEVQS